jgi:hypothetical protein
MRQRRRRGPHTRGLALLGLVAGVALLSAGPAFGSQLIDRNGQHVRIRTDDQGRALVSYTEAGKRKNVLVWGALNALPPAKGTQQVKFHFDYSGNQIAGFKGSCGHYDGPDLPNLVAACTAADGSYWAVQEWPAALPDLGFTPWTEAQRALAMDVSHWSGPVATLVAYPDWVYSGTFHSLFGRYTYDGTPVYGFGTTRYGIPTDRFGRLVYLDTYGSGYGDGWVRENSFVSHNPTGVFCYGFYSFDPTKGGYVHPPGETAMRGPGTGSKYRLLAMGPGVTPDVQTTVDDPGDFDRKSGADVAFRLKQWRLFTTFVGTDKPCRAGRALGAVNVVVQDSWFSSSPGGERISSFTVTKPLYFNVKFAQAPPTDHGVLKSATVLWRGPVGSNLNPKTPAVPVSKDGLVASVPFSSTNNRRYFGTWTATLVMNGLQVAQATVEARAVDGTLINLSSPTISGDTRAGSTLTVSNPGSWYGVPTGPTRFEYQWWRCTVPTGGGWSCYSISGATGSTYQLTSADVGSTINVGVTAFNAFGKSNQASPFQPTAVVTP